MIYKTFSAAETKVLDATRGLVDCVFSVTGVKDRQGDIIEPGAFRKALSAKSSVPVVYAHKWDSLDAVLGKTVAWRELMPGDPGLGAKLQGKGYGGVRATVQFDQETPSGRLALTHVTNGNIKDWSFAFDSNRALEKFDNDGTRRIHEIPEVYEVTLALIGANQEAMTLALKAMAMQQRETKTDAWLPGVIAKAHENEKRQFEASLAKFPLLAEAAAAILLSEESRVSTLFEYADANRYDRYLPVAIHEAGHCLVSQHFGLQPTAIKVHRNGNGGCDTPGGRIAPLDNAAIDLAGIAAEHLWGVMAAGKQLNSVDAKRPMDLSDADRKAATQSAFDILAANHALVAALALALYKQADGDSDCVVSGQEIQEISKMVDNLKNSSLSDLKETYHSLRNKRLGYPAWM